MIDKGTSPERDGTTSDDLHAAGLAALRKERLEGRRLRQLLRKATDGTVTVLAWRPSSPASTVVGMADVALGDLTIFDVRLVRLGGGFALSWPARKPIGGSGLQPIMRPTPALDGRALAAVLETAFPPTTVVLPQ